MTRNTFNNVGNLLEYMTVIELTSGRQVVISNVFALCTPFYVCLVLGW